MADVGVNIQYLRDLKERVREMQSACKELDAFFASGADRMAQEVDVEQLNTLTTRLKQHLEEAVSGENRARYALEKADIMCNIGGFIFKVIGSATGRDALFDGVERFEKERASKQRIFGMIMVCVGKGGLPDDVHVVSISEKARRQNRLESAIIFEIEKGGALLFTPDKFMHLVEGVIHNIRKGNLRLPILPEQLTPKLVPVRRPSLNIRRIDA